ncbi:hypothetical protein ACSNN7_12110 [Micromonospora sp. URMC 105]|uniref:hypothetical protein n=1 Tax=Micromonospora sp. URMC 105 TaxID=3423413 RepID=UPI003F1B48F8
MWDTPTIVLITGIMTGGHVHSGRELDRRPPRSAQTVDEILARAAGEGRIG